MTDDTRADALQRLLDAANAEINRLKAAGETPPGVLRAAPERHVYVSSDFKDPLFYREHREDILRAIGEGRVIQNYEPLTHTRKGHR